MNQAEAARAAGYSETSAKVQGCRLEAMPAIREAIARCKARDSVKAQAAVHEIKRLVEPSATPPTKQELADPLAFFSRVMTDEDQDADLRLKAAQQLAAFTVAKPVTKKQSKEAERKEAAEGSFFAQALRVVK